MVLLKRSDLYRYEELVTDLKRGAHVGRDEYPVTPADTFDLLTRISGVFDLTQQGCGGGQSSGYGGCGRVQYRVSFT